MRWNVWYDEPGPTSRRPPARDRVLANGHRQASQSEAPERRRGYRETVEAIVVAMILALLVRGFEAEAFVIPTARWPRP